MSTCATRGARWNRRARSRPCCAEPTTSSICWYPIWKRRSENTCCDWLARMAANRRRPPDAARYKEASMAKWAAFPRPGEFQFDAAGVRRHWERLHAGDAEPLPMEPAVLDAWVLF